ncbi:hypothetical protein I4641_06760 [Waterburya agarophytonicola K14]|uniref:Uncharacterized protein n=1 Tax=Waterburya agarophytonicola KI4 TaxID=2874699 RepID=A0A964BQM0_9CYAN|nr:hypothetical protein [Waterburya agarophytonicola]MCC0176678.1 hypothetical protein [Waterburya agarophytonicola KI4]
MLLQVNYLIRSRKDGKYLVARLPEKSGIEASYLLVFQQDYDALSYINTHGKEYGDLLTVETASPTQLKSLMLRWSYAGFGIVKDPLVPDIQFVS